MNKQLQVGFTLIELIMVIVILGVLSSFILPKFITLKETATYSALQGVTSALRSAHDFVYFQSVIQDNLDDLNGKTEVEEGMIDVHYGHPRTHWTITWQKILDIDAQSKSNGSKTEVCDTNQDFCAVYNVRHGTPGFNNDWSIYILPNGYAVNDNCYSRYSLDVFASPQHLIAFATEGSGC